jgi:peptidoglycan hydrolase CwlO-like protein
MIILRIHSEENTAMEIELIKLNKNYELISENVSDIRSDVKSLENNVSEIKTYQDDLDITKEEIFKLEDEIIRLWWCVEELNKVVY